jgi:uncharacterized protein involved in type VI secretion and phage assembly
MTNDQLIMELIERMRGRFYGKYRGSVTETAANDPDNRGRIKALVPAVLGNTPTGWCDPCVPYAGDGVGTALFPEKGYGVWIEFEGGDVSFPIWSGCYWRKGELPSDWTVPDQKGITTKAGHTVVLDDGSAASVTISDASGNKVVLDQNGVDVNSGHLKVT